MRKYKVAVLGATGMVGQRFIQLLVDHPWFELGELAASERRVGKTYSEEVNWLLPGEIPKLAQDKEMKPLDPKEVDADIAFSALPSGPARQVEPAFAEGGFVVASNASAFRMASDVPLMIPEVNPEHLKLIDVQKKKRNWDGFIVTNPNCTTIMFVITLKPLMDYGIKDVKMCSMQALSGAGYPGVPSLAVADNVMPYIKGEEEKVEEEPQKLLGNFDGKEIIPAKFTVSASCNRVGVVDGHTEAVWIDFDNSIEVDSIKTAFREFNPLDLPSSPDELIIINENPDRPQPKLDKDNGKGMSITVGRLKKVSPTQIKYICLGHNTIRGAAGASILNAELMVKEKLI